MVTVFKPERKHCQLNFRDETRWQLTTNRTTSKRIDVTTLFPFRLTTKSMDPLASLKMIPSYWAHKTLITKK